MSKVTWLWGLTIPQMIFATIVFTIGMGTLVSMGISGYRSTRRRRTGHQSEER